MRWCVLKENYNLNSMILMLIAASEEYLCIPFLGMKQNFAVRIYWPRSGLTRNRICKQVPTYQPTYLASFLIDGYYHYRNHYVPHLPANHSWENSNGSAGVSSRIIRYLFVVISGTVSLITTWLAYLSTLI